MIDNNIVKTLDILDIVTAKGIVELKGLSNKDFKKIRKVGEEYIIPIEIACKIKGVSKQAIYEAQAKGKLERVNGILLSSIKKYQVKGGSKK